MKALLPSSTLLGPVVPLYATPFTISLSKPLSVLKAENVTSMDAALEMAIAL